MHSMEDNPIKPCFLSNYMVDIVFFLFKVSDSMLEPSVRLYIYQESCTEGYNDSTCRHLEDFPEREEKVQVNFVSAIYLYAVTVIIESCSFLLD